MANAITYTIDCNDGKYLVITETDSKGFVLRETRLFTALTTVCADRESESVLLIGFDENYNKIKLSLDGSLGASVASGEVVTPENYTSCGETVALSTEFLQLRQLLANCASGCCGTAGVYREDCDKY